MSDLQLLWKAHSKEWASLGPVAIRRIVAAKDQRKLDIAMGMDDIDAAKEIAQSVLEDFLSNTGVLRPAWKELAESDLTGDEVTDLVEALFLYGLRAIQESGPEEASWLFGENEKMWSKKLPSAAMSILRKAYYDKIRPLSLAAFKGGPSGRESS